jgi:hypothetical protein
LRNEHSLTSIWTKWRGKRKRKELSIKPCVSIQALLKKEEENVRTDAFLAVGSQPEADWARADKAARPVGTLSVTSTVGRRALIDICK